MSAPMTDRAALLGTDLRLLAPDQPAFGEGSLGLDLRSDGSGDLQLASGDDNIVQALVLRLKTRQGELAPLGWPDHGSRLHELIGEPNVARTHAKLMAFARAAVERDARVARVSEAAVEQIPGERMTVRLTMTIVLVDRADPLNLVLDVQLEAR